jgi:glycosyltransferase involved in cell wall biosynthesis
VKVLVLTNLYPPDVVGGYELACRQVADALAARGHEVRVLTSSPRVPVAREPHVIRTLKLIELWNAPRVGWRSPSAELLDDAESRMVCAHNVYQLATVLEDEGPDVVYVCSVVGLGGLGLIGCLQQMQVPWVWQLGDDVPRYVCSKWGRVLPEVARQFGRLARGHFIVVSTRLRREIEASGVPLNGHVEVLPNWVVGEHPEGRTSYYRGGRLRVVSAGRLSPAKGIDLLIEAVARLRDEGCDAIELDLYGRAADVDETHYPDLILEHGVGDRVALKGARAHDDLGRLYAGYDLFAFPTWAREPFGLGPLEAAAHGCVPAIAAHCGLAEWLVHGVHCLKADRSAESFARLFREVIDGRIDLRPIAARASAAVARDFHLDAVIPRIERILRRASQQPRGRPRPADEVYRMALLA